MPILVICPSCKAQFNVSDKFAGKQGPCPKCKATITVPEPVEVKIHEPEEHAVGGKDQKGRPVTKPIERAPSRVGRIGWAVIAVGLTATLAATWFGGNLIRDTWAVRAVGLLVVTIPLVIGGYSILRDEELEPYRGKSFWMRTAFCVAAYGCLWGGFSLLPESLTSGEPWTWLLLAPPFIALGGAVAQAAFDLDYTTGCVHYGGYVLATLVLRAVAGMPNLWKAVEAAPI